MKAIQSALAAVLTFASATVFAVGIEIGGGVEQTVQADNIINMGMGSNSTSEQTLASIRGQVTVGGDVHQTVSAKNLINMAMGSGSTQTISSVDSH